MKNQGKYKGILISIQSFIPYFLIEKYLMCKVSKLFVVKNLITNRLIKIHS